MRREWFGAAGAGRQSASAENGADMSRPVIIDFSVEVPDERTARRVPEPG